MVTALPELAKELGTTDRTLRRAVEEGLVRGHRVSPRKFEMPISERTYLRENWPLLRELRAALRTEPSVRAAILFGSYARGEQHEASDIDIVVDRQPGPELRAVARRLSARLGRAIQLIALEDARKTPLLLAEVVRDGRVLVDRDETWDRLRGAEATIVRRAARERRRIDSEFAAAFDSAA
ncbi:MAG: type VII toxin-antitoxin system MntA family adenylyltransferase antitoxin [Gaiellaceae bacterium]